MTTTAEHGQDDDAHPSGVKAELTGLPETLLWTLWNRACEAGHADPVLDDPMAEALVRKLDYPFVERLGPPHPLFSQVQGLRSLTFDRAVRQYTDRHPEATVIALGEGLETGFWRVDNGRLRWLSVDLPEAVALRRALLPEHPRLRVLAQSATDLSWLDEIDAPEQGTIVTAQALMMYLRPHEVKEIIAACADRLPGGALILDSMPRWITKLTREGKIRIGELTIPPMHWSMAPDERPRLYSAHPRIADVRALTMERGRGVTGRLIQYQHLIPVFRSISPAVTLLRFA
ncbi:class I SAM-dependent methyltransferase [Streptomyces olivoreticuli]|uniref:class I SAM-dependent methyltransferase n=1 Tax=Streptomyces olivoreticuli TaxID=68246 RepID=UPI000E25146F|nr:class I SAM-dependent methyltransferase [Streptomyces olivoreticuli]